jgi:hypothetical protein
MLGFWDGDCVSGLSTVSWSCGLQHPSTNPEPTEDSPNPPNAPALCSAGGARPKVAFSCAEPPPTIGVDCSRRFTRPKDPTMPLCPLALTGVSNGVYYYYCFTCPGGTPAGGPDTRMHSTGVNCSNILDPMKLIGSKALAAVAPQSASNSTVIEPILLGDDAKVKGLPAYADFSQPIGKTFLNASWSVSATEDPKGTVATYKDPKGADRKVRLFTIEVLVAIDPILGPTRLLFQVGQEVDPKDSTGAPTVKKANHKSADSDFHHHIQLAEAADTRDFHVLLKRKD